MRSLNSLRFGFCVALAAAPAPCTLAAIDDNVAATWHFAGGARLADDTNFANVKKILALQTSLDFRDLALNRFSGWVASSLEFDTNAPSASLVRPLLDDLLASETLWGLGGASQGPLNFILAVQLDDKRAQLWQDNLRQALRSPGQSFKAGDLTGQRWNREGGKSFWILPARGWLLLGRGEDLQTLQNVFLQQLSQHGRPGPALSQSWLEADLDWPRLTHWAPDALFPFLPARTKITMTATNQTLRMMAKVVYPQPIPWKFDPWRIPSDIIRDPLISFTAGQDIAAFLNPDEPLSPLADNPLTGQYYVWALGEMGFQTYGAWPVDNATNSLQRIATQAPAALNPRLAKMKAGDLIWQPAQKTLVWGNFSTILGPYLQVAPETNGQYLLAGLFPLVVRGKPAPDELFQQIAGRANLVYYDWEGTGYRLRQWQLLSGILPMLPRFQPAPAAPAPTNGVAAARRTPKPIVIEENWIAGLTPMLMQENTVTEITRAGPAELAVVRKSSFAVTALELVVLSHWLSGTGSAGLNPTLLPPPAKVTGPGINPKSP